MAGEGSGRDWVGGGLGGSAVGNAVTKCTTILSAHGRTLWVLCHPEAFLADESQLVAACLLSFTHRMSFIVRLFGDRGLPSLQTWYGTKHAILSRKKLCPLAKTVHTRTPSPSNSTILPIDLAKHKVHSPDDSHRIRQHMTPRDLIKAA